MIVYEFYGKTTCNNINELQVMNLDLLKLGNDLIFKQTFILLINSFGPIDLIIKIDKFIF